MQQKYDPGCQMSLIRLPQFPKTKGWSRMVLSYSLLPVSVSEKPRQDLLQWKKRECCPYSDTWLLYLQCHRVRLDLIGVLCVLLFFLSFSLIFVFFPHRSGRSGLQCVSPRGSVKENVDLKVDFGVFVQHRDLGVARWRLLSIVFYPSALPFRGNVYIFEQWGGRGRNRR